MSETFARDILRRNIAQICQTIGWNGINSTSLDILVHVLEKYITSLGTQASRYAEQFNRTEPNLHDLGLVFRDLNVQLPELAEYTRSVPPVPPPIAVDKFPKPKESNLNFLKPGSHEVVTRPMHVHEHLPPMYPEKERETPAVAGTVEVRQNGIDNVESTASCTSPEASVTDSPEKPKDIFKRPIDPVSLPNSKRPRLRLEEEERTREISSVMMTMSGFLSPAREGKLPEARPPTIVSEKHYDKHKANSNSNPMKVPVVEKSDKKSKKSKLLNGKIMKSKRKDKSHKGESSKSKDSSKLSKYPPGHSGKIKDGHPNHVKMPAAKATPGTPKIGMPPPPSVPLVPEQIAPIIKQEPIDTITDPQPSGAPRNVSAREDAIPVPRKIPISKSPLVANPVPVNKQSSANTLIPNVEIKKEVVDDEEKLASQPDRSKINIFKRISNKSKEDKSTPEVVPEKLQSDSLISRLQNSAHENTIDKAQDNLRAKADEPIVNNNDNSALDYSKVMDLRTNEVISIDDDSMDMHTTQQLRPPYVEPRPSISINKSLPVPKDPASVSPKMKKEKKHKDKKDKQAKLEAKLLKKQQQQLALERAQAEKQSIKMTTKSPKGRPKNDAKMPQMPPGFPFFPGLPPGRGLMPGPGLIPNPGLIPGSDFLAGLANNPALRGLSNQNLLTNPFALGTAGPGLIPAPNFLQSLGAGIPNPLMGMSNFPHTSRSMKMPPMFRRPSLEVIPVENDEDRGLHKSPVSSREKDRHNKRKSPTIPNILQKHKSKGSKDHKASLYKMPPVQPDITIELNPPKEREPVKQEPPRQLPPPVVRSPTPEPVAPPQPEIKLKPEPIEVPIEIMQDRDIDPDKKKEKSHKKDKKDRDGIKIKKKKDKKDKNKDKSDKKQKQELKQLKDKIKKEKKEKKKERVGDGLVPKLTLKLGSSNSNSPMPPSSPDVYKLNIKPVVKKDEVVLPPPEVEVRSRSHSRSPELAQIAALVTRPPKPKHSKHNHVEAEATSASPHPPGSPPRRNRPPSSHSKYKRILLKPLKKNAEHFEEEQAAEDAPTAAAASAEGPLPTPYYVDEHGNKIWVCPACGRPDNGSLMIGCDGCDDWYHWVCVGISEEPAATEDWFCKACLAKRAAMVLAGAPAARKRGRKPKAEKLRDCH